MKVFHTERIQLHLDLKVLLIMNLRFKKWLIDIITDILRWRYHAQTCVFCLYRTWSFCSYNWYWCHITFLGYSLSKLYMHYTGILEIVIQTQHLDLLWVKLHQSNEIVGVASFCGQHLRYLSEMLNTS